MEERKTAAAPAGGRSWGAPPHETILRTEDLLTHGPVLCYGCGGAFQSVAPYMAACGIDLAGVIDANKKGSVAFAGRQIPILSKQAALDTYGTDVIVIVTIADRPVYRQVRQDLMDLGYAGDRIFDLNAWTWLTAPSEESHCRQLDGYLQFFPAALSKCCNTGVVDAFLCEWFLDGQPLEESIDRFLEKRAYYMEESKRGRVPLYCRGCSFLTQEPEEDGGTIKEFVVSDHAFCNADCVYCCDACTVPRRKTGASVEERYAAILYALERFQREGVLDKRSIVQFAGGEITINPYKEEIYEAAKRALAWSPELRLEFFSNCFLYDQAIADILSLGKASYLQCDLDAGTPETYIKVKGFNRFDVVRENLKKYAQYGTVKLKYIVLPGWNDSQADYEGTIALMESLGLKELILSMEFGLSRDGDRMHVREALYAAARFMALLEREGMQAALPDAFWKSGDAAVAKRLCREIRSLEGA